MYIFMSSTTLLQYGRGALEVPGHGWGQPETAGKPQGEDTKAISHLSRGLIGWHDIHHLFKLWRLKKSAFWSLAITLSCVL